MKSLEVYNTLHRKKEKFVPLKEGFVGMYVCGPTVYGHAHLGHAKSYLSFDLIVRYLRYLGYQVRYVQNITDVGHMVDDAEEGEDKIIKQARLEKIEPMEVVETYTRSFFEDMDALNVLRPDISPRASGHIPEQIELIEQLINKGFAYEKEGNVYFDVLKFKNYGQLSGRNVDELIAGVRVDVKDDKKHPADFALWKKAEPEHIMRWKSPWSVGYPGWHLECSSMSNKYLGETFDIHGGGLENMFPHHECEIAQSEAANNATFTRYWLHNNMVTVDGVKMGKSLGNYITVKDALIKYPAMAIRFFVLSSHYRSPVDFSDEALGAAEKGYDRIIQNLKRLIKVQLANTAEDNDLLKRINQYEVNFEQSMNDDFNSPKAIAAIFDFFRDLNSVLDKSNDKLSKANFEKIMQILNTTVGDVLGLMPADSESLTGDTSGIVDEVMQIIIELRSRLRAARNYELADIIRDRLSDINVEIKDTPSGSSWELK